MWLKVVNAQMLTQPLERDDSYKNGCKTEDEAEEPEDVDADVGGRRGKGGIHKALRSGRGSSVCCTFKLCEDAQQEDVRYIARVPLETLVRFDDERGNDGREETGLRTDETSKP